VADIDLIETYLASRPDPFPLRVREIYANEGVIAAIKFVRIETDIGLAEAKHYVDDLCADLPRYVWSPVNN
jgi:ribosomal protein L7/L12